MNDTIVVLDTGLCGFGVFCALAEIFPKHRLIYENNLKFHPYLGRPEAEIKQLAADDLKRAMTEEPGILAVVSDTIVEYAGDDLENMTIPVIRIDDAIVGYVNENHEQKTMALLARRNIIDANLYQKRFNYRHLYNIASDGLEALVEKGNVKTSESFAAVRAAFANIPGRSVDILIIASPCLINLRAEFREYLNYQTITDIGLIFANSISKLLPDAVGRRRGERIVKTSVSANVFREQAAPCDFKYKIRGN